MKKTPSPSAKPASSRQTPKPKPVSVQAEKSLKRLSQTVKKVVVNDTPETIEKKDKSKKPKLVRDSFTIPKEEYPRIELLKKRALGLAHAAKKSEVLRAGLALLTSLNDDELLAALQAVPQIKTGRPGKTKKSSANAV